MRVSRNTPNCSDYKIYLNGEGVPCPVFADDEMGIVTVYKLDNEEEYREARRRGQNLIPSYVYKTTKEGKRIPATETLHGRVEIRLEPREG